MPSFRDLSARELQVVMMLSQGKLYKEIAAELEISAVTVSAFLYRAVRKLGFRTKDQLLFHYGKEISCSQETRSQTTAQQPQPNAPAMR